MDINVVSNGDRNYYTIDVEVERAKVSVDGVKTYVPWKGWILYHIGYASKDPFGNYVNRRSFLKHFVEGYLRSGLIKWEIPKNGINENNIKAMVLNIEKDRKIDKSEFTSNKIDQFLKLYFIQKLPNCVFSTNKYVQALKNIGDNQQK